MSHFGHPAAWAGRGSARRHLDPRPTATDQPKLRAVGATSEVLVIPRTIAAGAIPESFDCAASRLLLRPRDLGVITAIDTVSSPDPSFPKVAVAALRQADILFANKIEASRILGEQIAADVASTGLRAEKIAALGCPGRGAVHSTGGAVCRERGGILCSQASLKLPDNFIKGSTGAGDAFTPGFLSGVHDDSTAVECLLRGEYVAAASLTHLTPSLGVSPLDE